MMYMDNKGNPILVIKIKKCYHIVKLNYLRKNFKKNLVKVEIGDYKYFGVVSDFGGMNTCFDTYQEAVKVMNKISEDNKWIKFELGAW